MSIAIQLYSLRDYHRGDIDGMLEKLAAIGYAGVEFAGFYGLSAGETAGLLKKHNLAAAGSHVGADLLRADLRGAAEYHQAIGCRHISIPHYTFPNAAAIDALAAETAGWVPVLAEYGITLSYHNHGHEFEKIDGTYILDRLAAAAPELAFQIDCGWSYAAGVDTPAYVAALGARCVSLHIKDIVMRDGRPISVAVGTGEMDYCPIIAAANVEWLIVEVEESAAGDGFVEVAESWRNLKELV